MSVRRTTENLDIVVKPPEIKYVDRIITFKLTVAKISTRTTSMSARIVCSWKPATFYFTSISHILKIIKKIIGTESKGRHRLLVLVASSFLV